MPGQCSSSALFSLPSTFFAHVSTCRFLFKTLTPEPRFCFSFLIAYCTQPYSIPLQQKPVYFSSHRSALPTRIDIFNEDLSSWSRQLALQFAVILTYDNFFILWDLTALGNTLKLFKCRIRYLVPFLQAVLHTGTALFHNFMKAKKLVFRPRYARHRLV